jgi:hypothetical protein
MELLLIPIFVENICQLVVEVTSELWSSFEFVVNFCGFQEVQVAVLADFRQF